MLRWGHVVPARIGVGFGRLMLWLGFLLCTLLILYSGSRLSKYGDIIAEKTGLGRTWVGVVLMASVTSLPELVTGISSVTFAGAPDIAAGDVLGSCVFNMLILAGLDTVCGPQPISSRAHHGQVLSAAFGALLISIAGGGIALGGRLPAFGWIGLYSPAIILVYLIAMRIVYSYEKRQIAAFVKEVAIELKYEKVPTRKAVINYLIHALVVVAAAVFLPGIGTALAKSTGLGQTFVGSILIAVSTSLPEVVVSLAAVRMDAVDLAIGNLFGSTIFNIFILSLDDLFFIRGPILSFVDSSALVPALSAIAMSAVAIIGLTYRNEKKPLFLAWDSIAIVLIYLGNLMLLYMLRPR
jgi:cation:H+ antiporter